MLTRSPFLLHSGQAMLTVYAPLGLVFKNSAAGKTEGDFTAPLKKRNAPGMDRLSHSLRTWNTYQQHSHATVKTPARPMGPATRSKT